MLRRIGVGGCELNKEILDYSYSFLKDDEILVIDEGSGYQGQGASENIVGEWLKENQQKRNKCYLIDKLPLYGKWYIDRFSKETYDMNDAELEDTIRQTLDEQLNRCHTSFFDCYMLHAIYDDKYSQNYDEDRDTDLYKRIVPILVKLKEERKIKNIGFSAHVDYKTLLYFLSEVDPDNKIFDTAEISYNILNSRGASLKNPCFCQKYYQNVMVWDAIGERGIQYLKSLKYKIFNCMPLESGRIKQINDSKPFIRWAEKFVWDNKDIDVILAGTSKKEHLDDWLIFTKDKEDFVPDMRDLGIDAKVCGISA